MDAMDLYRENLKRMDWTNQSLKHNLYQRGVLWLPTRLPRPCSPCRNQRNLPPRCSLFVMSASKIWSAEWP